MEEKAIPKELSDVFEHVRSQVIRLHSRWIIYRQLFGISKDRIDLLNESASTFFYVIQDALMDDVQLTLSKLSDPAQTRGNKNLSLEFISQIVKELGKDELASKLRNSLSSFKEKCSVFRKRRNKKLAHFDYETLMNRSSQPLPGISRQMIEDALQELRNFMNLIDLHFRGTSMGYEHVITSNDGETLVAILKRGLYYEELLKTREIKYNDLQSSKYYKA